MNSSQIAIALTIVSMLGTSYTYMHDSNTDNIRLQILQDEKLTNEKLNNLSHKIGYWQSVVKKHEEKIREVEKKNAETSRDIAVIKNTIEDLKTIMKEISKDLKVLNKYAAIISYTYRK